MSWKIFSWKSRSSTHKYGMQRMQNIYIYLWTIPSFARCVYLSHGQEYMLHNYWSNNNSSINIIKIYKSLNFFQYCFIACTYLYE